MESEEKIVKAIGTPSLLMLPARNYSFKVFKEEYVITIPRRGCYKDLDNDFFKDEDGDFDVLKRVDSIKGEILYIPSLSKILFATSQYPDLSDGQAFIPIALVIKEDEVDIIGNIIQMVKED